MQKNSSARRTGVMNIIMAFCLGLFTSLAILFILSPEGGYSPSMAWEEMLDGLKSGTMYLNGGPLSFSAIGYFLLGLWSCVSFVGSLLACLRKKPFAKEATIVWTGILFGVTLFLMLGSFVLNARCIPVIAPETSDVCTLSVHPGVLTPSPNP